MNKKAIGKRFMVSSVERLPTDFRTEKIGLYETIVRFIKINIFKQKLPYIIYPVEKGDIFIGSDLWDSLSSDNKK